MVQWCKDCQINAVSKKYKGLCYDCARRRRRKNKPVEPHPLLATSAIKKTYRRCMSNNQKEKARRLRLALRHQVFDHYGWSCQYCGATDNLQLDHINGDGLADRQNGKGKYKDVVADGFPDTFQTLCAKCNWMKGSMNHNQFVAVIDNIHSHLHPPS